MIDDEETPEIIDLTTLDTKDTKVLSKEPNQLSVPLTDAEKIDVGRLLGERLVEHERLEEIEKSRSSAARAQKKSRELEHARLGKISATGCEDRQVDVLCIAVLSSNARLRVREDTGEVLDSRALTGPERDKLQQQPLPLPPEAGEVAPLPARVRDLVPFIKSGQADGHLDALEADTRPSIEKAVKARRVVLTDEAIAEAEAEAPKPKNL